MAFVFCLYIFHTHLNFIFGLAADFSDFKEEHHLSLTHVSTFSLLQFSGSQHGLHIETPGKF